MPGQKLPRNGSLQHLLLNTQIGIRYDIMVVKSQLQLFKRFLQSKESYLTGIIRGLSLFQHPFLDQREEGMADDPAARIAARCAVYAEVFQMSPVHTCLFF
ncbi:hypothetical protein D3C80_1966340 [compost metagenome]